MVIMALYSCTIDRLLLTTYFNILPSKMVGTQTYTTVFSYLFSQNSLNEICFEWNRFVQTNLH